MAATSFSGIGDPFPSGLQGPVQPDPIQSSITTSVSRKRRGDDDEGSPFHSRRKIGRDPHKSHVLANRLLFKSGNKSGFAQSGPVPTVFSRVNGIGLQDTTAAKTLSIPRSQADKNTYVSVLSDHIDCIGVSRTAQVEPHTGPFAATIAGLVPIAAATQKEHDVIPPFTPVMWKLPNGSGPESGQRRFADDPDGVYPNLEPVRDVMKSTGSELVQRMKTYLASGKDYRPRDSPSVSALGNLLLAASGDSFSFFAELVRSLYYSIKYEDAQIIVDATAPDDEGAHKGAWVGDIHPNEFTSQKSAILAAKPIFTCSTAGVYLPPTFRPDYNSSAIVTVCGEPVMLTPDKSLTVTDIEKNNVFDDSVTTNTQMMGAFTIARCIVGKLHTDNEAPGRGWDHDQTTGVVCFPDRISGHGVACAIHQFTWAKNQEKAEAEFDRWVSFLVHNGHISGNTIRRRLVGTVVNDDRQGCMSVLLKN